MIIATGRIAFQFDFHRWARSGKAKNPFIVFTVVKKGYWSISRLKCLLLQALQT